MTKILLEVKSLKKTYEHKNGIIKLFDNVNIKIKKGELIALTGPSGSGKSSFLHMLALLDSPTKGKIFIKDKDTKDLKEFEKDNIRRKNISIIFQDNNLLTDFTVIENVIMPLIIKGESLKSAKEKAMKILKDIKIINRIDHFPNEISGGEQQRVAIARSVLNNPALIIADEPTGNLDPETSLEIIELFQRLNKIGTSMIIATHDYNLILKLKGKVYKCEDGEFFEVKRK